MFRGTDKMSKRNLLSIGTWVGLAAVLWTLGWIIAEAIPVFNNLLSLIVALFASWFTCKSPVPCLTTSLTRVDGLSGVFWLFINKGRYFASKRQIFLTILNILVFAIGAAIVRTACILVKCQLTLSVRPGSVCLRKGHPRRRRRRLLLLRRQLLVRRLFAALR